MKVSINQLLSTNFSKDKQLESRFLQRDNCLVGWVDSFNSNNNTVNIQPAIQSEIMLANQTTQLKNKPFLINCPIISNTLSRVPQKGDKALVFVLDEKSNNFFKATYNSSKPLEQQTFVNQSKAYKTLSNCVAFIINPNPVTGGSGGSSLTSLSFKPINGELVYNNGVATAGGNFEYTTTENETPASIKGSIQTNIVGNGGVIVDADETDSTLEIHLDDTVLTTNAQTFTETQQEQVRQNIGAGTSDFSGDYNDLTNKPTIPQSGITKIVGTEENPINLYSDLNAGNYYIITGYVITSTTNVYQLTIEQLTYKITNNEILIYDNAGISNEIRAGVDVVMYCTSSGAISSLNRAIGFSSLNGTLPNSAQPIYAPTTYGTSGQVLQSNGANQAPSWVNANFINSYIFDDTTYTSSNLTNTTSGLNVLIGTGAGTIQYSNATYGANGMTFSVGRPVINSSEQMAFLSDIPTVVNATTAQAGIIQIATSSDIETGTNVTKAVTPNQLKTAIDGLGTVFNLKGSVQSVSNLPTTNNQIGDVWYVVDESVGYIWLNDGTTDRWEQLGLAVDLSNYIQYSDIVNNLTSTEINKPLSAYQGNVLQTSINQINSNINSLQTNVNNKSSTYINNVLSNINFTSDPQTQINTINTTITNNYNTLNSAIQSETTSRESADSNLQSQINNLVTGVSSVAGNTGDVSTTQLINAILTGNVGYGDKITQKNITTNGVYGVQSGLEIRWGSFSTSGTGSNVSVSFNSPFSNTCYAVVACVGSNARSAGLSLGVGSVSRTGFTAYPNTFSGSYRHYYIAIGS